MLKKKFKKAICLLLCLLIVLSNMAYAGTTESAAFSDIVGNKYETILNKWIEKGFIKGYPDGTIKPYDKIVRSEIAAMVNRVFNLKESDNPKYDDVYANDWYYNDVGIAHKSGYMIGDDLNNFNPRNNITRQELAAIAVRLGKTDKFIDKEVLNNFEDSALIPEWSKGIISSAVKMGLFKDFIKEKFSPAEQVSRLEVIVVLERLINFVEDGEQVDISSDMEGLKISIAGLDKITNTTFEDSTRQYTKYNLPETITFNLPDGQKIVREIIWPEETVNTQKSGTQTITGNVPGYGEIILTLTVTRVSSGGSSEPSKPQINSIVPANGTIDIVLSQQVSGLALSDFVVLVKDREQTVELADKAYNAETKKITFTPLLLSEHYGELNVTVSAASGSTKITGSKEAALNLFGFSGNIVDEDDNPVSGMTILFRLNENAGPQQIMNIADDVVGTAVTDTNGNYLILLPQGNYEGELSGDGFITTYFNVVCSPLYFNQNENGVAVRVPGGEGTRIVLTWGSVPSDLDSHLLGPTPDGGMFHVYYGNKVYRYENEIYVELDLDDTSSYGPETTTVIKYVSDGVYRFYVHNWSGSPSLTVSNAKVNVYSGDSNIPIKTYNVPVIGEGLYWLVFDMAVNNNQIIFTDINSLLNSEPEILEEPTNPQLFEMRVNNMPVGAHDITITQAELNLIDTLSFHLTEEAARAELYVTTPLTDEDIELVDESNVQYFSADFSAIREANGGILPPGEYCFTLKLTNNIGVVTEQAIAVTATADETVPTPDPLEDIPADPL